MAATFNFYLDNRGVTAGNQAPLKLTIRHRGKVTFLNTNIRLVKNQWDLRHSSVVRHPNALRINAYLHKISMDIDAVLLDLAMSGKLVHTDIRELREIVQGIVDPDKKYEESRGFLAFFTDYVVTKNNPRTKSTYTNTLKLLSKFDKSLASRAFDDIDAKYLKSFEVFLIADAKLKQNSVCIHLRNIRAVFNAAITDEVTTAYPFRKVKIKGEATRDRSMTAEELRMLMCAPCADWQKEYIDMFLLMFFLRGINIGDLALLKSMHDGRIEYYRQKTGKLYSIKVEPEALRLIKKYKGRHWLLSISDRNEDYRYYMKNLNNGLKTIGLRYENGKKYSGKPMFPKISTYCARYAWASIASELDIPRETIAAALGHSWVDVTSVYIRNDMRKKVDEANRRVLDYVLYAKDWRQEERDERNYGKLMMERLSATAH